MNSETIQFWNSPSLLPFMVAAAETKSCTTEHQHHMQNRKKNTKNVLQP